MSEEAIVEYLARHIESAYASDGFVGVVIYGLQGVGKSCLALRVAHRVVGSWPKVLNRHLLFTAEEVEARLDEAFEKGFRWKTLIWDDAGVYAGKYLHRTDLVAARWLAASIQLIRTHTASLIVTTTSPAELFRSLREQPDWLRVRMRPLSVRPVKRARVTVYRIDVDPIGKPVAAKIVENARFTVYLPDDVYRKYKRIREAYRALAKELRKQKEKETET